MNDQFLEWARG